MTKGMYKDYIKELKRKNRGLIIALCIVTTLLIVMAIIAFSTFEINYEYTEDNTYDITQNTDGDGDGDGASNQNVDISTNKDNLLLYIVGFAVVLICTIVTIIGVLIYGKSKNNNP